MTMTSSQNLEQQNREQRFAQGFEQRVKKLISTKGLLLPPHKWSPEITELDVLSISGTKKQKTGIPVLLFKSRGAPLLLTSKGLFFSQNWSEDHESQRGMLSWEELNWVAGRDLLSDERAVSVRTDFEALRSKIPSWVSALVYTCFIVWEFITTDVGDGNFFLNFFSLLFRSLELIFLILLTPIVVFFLHKIIRRVLPWLFSAVFNPHNNLLVIGGRQIVDLGFRRKAEDVAEVVALGLMIYRRQQEKYGPETS